MAYVSSGAVFSRIDPSHLCLDEEGADLKRQLQKETRGRQKERLQALYLLKTGQVQNATELPYLLGRSDSTIKNGLKIYRHRGLNGLLELQHGGGKSFSLSNPVLTPLQERRRNPQGFSDYQAIQTWLTTTYGIDIPYKTLWGIVHNRLQAHPQVVRPQSQARNESTVAEFEKKSQAIKYFSYSPSL
ncbi:transposase [Thioploca ingrica]|uniref:Transposase n=1 Tax=Thioploca ingrica TaxID=40754 RepID=A0A090AMM6_9GAMM|nr:transposase [Thioploca ingrica]